MKTALHLALLFALSGPLMAVDLSDTTDISITKSWSQETAGWTYPMAISLPDGSTPEAGWPVCILLHGFGSNGQAFVGQFRELLDCHVLIGPTGYLNCWNICTEPSEAPDVEMVGDLIDELQAFDNVDANRIHILGVSNGSALANSVLIENNDPGLTSVVSIVSQMSEYQFHDGDFFSPSGTTNPNDDYCGYDTPESILPGRRYLGISNMNDFIPYFGGSSGVGVDFLPAQLAAFHVATTQGYEGAPIEGDGVLVEGDIFEYVYPGTDVVHLRGFAQHGINSIQEAYVRDFLNGCEVIADCHGDLNGDQVIDVQDILDLIGVWNTLDENADLDEDGLVDADDLLELLSLFGTDCRGVAL